MSDVKQSVRVGVFGAGSLGQHHVRVYAEMAQAELVGIFDADSVRAAELAAQHHTRAFDSMEALAAEVDAASVAVPTDLHREVAGFLLEQKVHLLVEKPIAATTSEAEQLVTLAQENDLILQVGHIERFNPVLSFLEQHTAIFKLQPNIGNVFRRTQHGDTHGMNPGYFRFHQV